MYIDIKDQNGDIVALPVVVEIAGRLFASVEHLGTNLMAGYYGDSDAYEVEAGSEQNGSILAQFGKDWKLIDEGTEREKKAVKIPSVYDQFLSSVDHFVQSKYPSSQKKWIWTEEGEKIDGTAYFKNEDFKTFLKALIKLKAPTEAGSGSGVFAHTVDILFYIFWAHLPCEYKTGAEHKKLSFLCDGKQCKESEKLAMHWSGHQPPVSEQARQNIELNNGKPTASLSEGSV